MTLEELQAIKARAEAATPGPWTTESYGKDDRSDVEIQHVRASNGHTVVTTDCNVYTTDEDAIFIAHARTDVPALVEEVERLQAENDQMRTVIAAEKNSADAYVAAFDAEVDRRATAEEEVERLRGALEVCAHARDLNQTRARKAEALCVRAADKLDDDCIDDGPPGEGWKSDELNALIAELRAMK